MEGLYKFAKFSGMQPSKAIKSPFSVKITAMAPLQIRPANHLDLAALDRLYYEFHQYHARAVPERLVVLGDLATQDWTEFHRILDHILADPNAVILLACENGQPVGLAEVWLRHHSGRLVAPGTYGTVESLYVEPAWRGRGIARALMAAAQSWAVERGAVEMRLEVWEFNHEAIGLYKALGYATETWMMSRPVDGPES